MQLTTQLIHYHILICIVICYKNKGNIIILLSSLELKSDFISIETPLIRCWLPSIYFFWKAIFASKKTIYISYFEFDFFITMTATLDIYCLPEFPLHMTMLKIFWKLDSTRCDYTASNKKQIKL